MVVNKSVQLSFAGFESPKELIGAHHYRKGWPSGKSHTYVFEEAIVVFSIPANPYIGRWLGCRVWEFSRLWAPDGHEPNLLTRAISYAARRFGALRLCDCLISYADPNVGHSGGVYRAASWAYLGRCSETRGWLKEGHLSPRRAFHAGKQFLRKADIEALGYQQVQLEGKLRFARALTKIGKRALAAKVKALAE